MEHVEVYQWILLVGISLLLLVVAPVSTTITEFFNAKGKNRKPPNYWVLTSSLVISWIFAKSITISADLGMEFGIVGGVAYAGYYLSFLVAGFVIHRIRTKGGYNSLHELLGKKFGPYAVLLFSLMIGFRLFNEVWSNTMVIGTYFGEKGSGSYYLAILVFTFLTLAYSLKGGLRSSLLTDVLQIGLFGGLLFIILYILVPEGGGVINYASSGSWTMAGGLDLLLVAVLQMFSYPFHDPVMTDRGFISSPGTTLKSFVTAAFIGGAMIILFSFVGIHASGLADEGSAAVIVSRSFGSVMMLVMNLIMVTSAASTLDSALFSFSKLTTVDLRLGSVPSVKKGRVMMILVAIAGTLPIWMDPEILSATTISGTMVIGLAPVFLFWDRSAPSSAFFLSTGIGVALGIALSTGIIPEGLFLTDTKYAGLLTVNLIGMFLCLTLYGGASLLLNGWRKEPRT